MSKSIRARRDRTTAKETGGVRSGIQSMLIIATMFFMTAPAQAQRAGAAAAVAPPPAASQPPSSTYPYPVYSVPAWVHPNSVRCEQDRLLTDTTPCGLATETATPRPPCQQDRLLTDHTPCTKP